MGVLSPDRQGDAPSLAPMGLEPGRLWSLWDMITKYAWQFFILSRFVEDIAHRLNAPIYSPAPTLENVLQPYSDGITGSRLSPIPMVALPSGNEGLTEEQRETFSKTLEMLKNACISINILSITNEFDRISACLTYATKSYQVSEGVTLRGIPETAGI
jgi:hypothetical protein